MDAHLEDHDLGLAHDLKTIESRMMERRRALILLGSAGTVGLLAGCGGGGSSATGTGSSSSSSSTSSGSTSTSTGGSTSSSTSSSSGGSGGTCIADPGETNGPYPADGTNTSSGITSNALTQSGIVRSDIRSSFLGSSTAQAAGVAVTLTLTVVNVNNSCAPLAGYAVYIWHCDRDGKYSLYDLPGESYLRGVQVTDSNGQISFTTIFPGCYSGRYPHIHFEVFSSLANATSGRYATLISQLAMPAAACNTVYASTGYSTSATNFARVSISSDNVFGDNTSAQVTAMTPTMTGSVAAGYTGTATIGLAL